MSCVIGKDFIKEKWLEPLHKYVHDLNVHDNGHQFIKISTLQGSVFPKPRRGFVLCINLLTPLPSISTTEYFRRHYTPINKPYIKVILFLLTSSNTPCYIVCRYISTDS